MKRMNLLLKIMAASFIILIIAFIAANYQGYFNIKKIEFNYNPNINQGKMFEILELKKGKSNIFFAGSSDMENHLKSIGGIKDARVTKKYPDTLQVSLNFNNLIGAIKYTNLYIIINEAGEVVEVRSAPGKLTVIEGLAINHFKNGSKVDVEDKNIFDRVLALLIIAERTQIKSIDAITYEDGAVVAKVDKEYKVNFGKMENVEKSFNYFVSIYEDLKRKDLKGGMIDVSDNQLPTWRPFEN